MRTIALVLFAGVLFTPCAKADTLAAWSLSAPLINEGLGINPTLDLCDVPVQQCLNGDFLVSFTGYNAGYQSGSGPWAATPVTPGWNTFVSYMLSSDQLNTYILLFGTYFDPTGQIGTTEETFQSHLPGANITEVFVNDTGFSTVDFAVLGTNQVPEPNTALMLLCGLVTLWGMIAVVRRRPLIHTASWSLNFLRVPTDAKKGSGQFEFGVCLESRYR
jgi:hypothetical protein